MNSTDTFLLQRQAVVSIMIPPKKRFEECKNWMRKSRRGFERSFVRFKMTFRSCSKINEMRTRRFSRPLNRCAVSRRLSLALALLSDFFDRANAPALARRPWTLPRPSGGTLERQVTGCHAGAWEPSSSPPPRGTRPPVAGQQERRRPGLFGAEKKRPSC